MDKARKAIDKLIQETKEKKDGIDNLKSALLKRFLNPYKKYGL